MEVRAVPTVLYNPVFGPETILPTPNHDYNFQTLADPTVYLIFWGTYWGQNSNQGQDATLAQDAQTILESPFLSPLAQYGQGQSPEYGKAQFGGWYYDSQSGDPAAPFDAGSSTYSGQIQSEIANAISHSGGAIPAPQAGSTLLTAPIYVVITAPDVANNNGGYNVPGSYASSGGQTTPINMISVGVGSGPDDYSFGLTMSHEMVERMSDPTGNTYGVGVQQPASFGTTGINQLADGEPELRGVDYSYQLHVSQSPSPDRVVNVQPWWSADSVTYQGAQGAYIVADGNAQTIQLDPIWTTLDLVNGVIRNPVFSNTYKLEIRGDQIFGPLDGTHLEPNDHLTIDDSGGITTITLNDEQFYFASGRLADITVDLGEGANTVDVTGLEGGTTLTVDDSNGGTTSVNVGSGGSLAPVQGPVGDYAKGTLSLDAHADATPAAGGNITINDVAIMGLTAQPIDFPSSGGPDTLDIRGAGGTNTFNLTAMPAIPLLLSTGRGINIVNISQAYGDLGVVDGDVSVVGGGNTTLDLFDRQDSTDATYTITNAEVATTRSASIFYSNIQVLALEGGDGTDITNVESTERGTQVDVDTGAGYNIVNASPTDQQLADLAGGLHVLSGGNTQLTLSDEKNGDPEVYTISGTTSGRTIVQGQNSAPIEFDGDGLVSLDGNNLGNTYLVESTAPDAGIVLDTGLGENIIDVAPASKNLADIRDELTINGTGFSGGFTEGGSNRVFIDDQGGSPAPGAAGSTYAVGTTTAVLDTDVVVDETTIAKDLSSQVNYAGLGSVTLNGDAGNDTYDVYGTVAGATVTLDTGAGANSVLISPLDKKLTDLGSDVFIQAPTPSLGTTVTIDNSNGASAPGSATVPVPDLYEIGPDSTAFRDPITVHYTGVTAVTLDGGSTGNYVVNGIPAGATYTLNPGVGPNTFDVAPGLQGLILNGLATGPLTIDDSANTGNATYTVTSTTIQMNGSTPIVYTGAPSLIVEGGSGKDTFNVQSTTPLTPVTLMAGTGGNLVNVGAGAEDLSLIQGDLTLHGQGQTIAVLDDQSDIYPIFFGLPDIYLVTDSTVQNLLSAKIHYSGLAGLTLNGDTLDDPYDVESTAAGTPVTLNLGPGNNSVTVATYSKTLANLKAPLVIHSAAASPAGVTVYDSNDTGAAAYTITDSTVQAAGSAPITYAGAASLTVDGGSGTDAFDVQGTAAATPVTLNGGSGADTFNIGDSRQTLEEFLGPLTVNGQAGSTMNINDGGELDPATQGSDAGYHTEDDVWSPAGGGLPASAGFFHLPAGVIAQPGSAGFVTTYLYWKDLAQITFTDPIGGSTAEHTFQPDALDGTHLTLKGGTVNDTLVSGASAGQAQTFTVTGSSAGTVGNITYTGEVYLISTGAGMATFRFLPGGFESAVNGDGSPAILDLSAYGDGTTVMLPYRSGTIYNWGSVPGAIQLLASITSVIGASGDTLVGGQITNDWSITGLNSGTVGGLPFTGFANLTGGGMADTFAFVNGGSLTGTLNGGGGVNTLDESGYTGDVTVDLPMGAASLVGGGIKNIRNVVGSVGNDILVGDGTGNTLTGGTGRNLLIAGGGPATLIGGPGDDILVGGQTSFDTQPAALAAIMSEWTRTDLGYAARVDHLLEGGGKNGNSLLNIAAFTPNAGGNTLTGAGGLDLFYGSMARDLNDRNAGLGEIFVDPAAPATLATMGVTWGKSSVGLQLAADGLRMLPQGRHTDLPWSGINQISFTFNQNVVLSPGDVHVTGVNVADYGPVTISGSGAQYTITLARPITKADRVTIAIGNTLIAPFARRLDVLPGDFNDDGTVNAVDLRAVFNLYLLGTYLGVADVNGDGVVDLTDVELVREGIGSHL